MFVWCASACVYACVWFVGDASVNVWWFDVPVWLSVSVVCGVRCVVCVVWCVVCGVRCVVCVVRFVDT